MQHFQFSSKMKSVIAGAKWYATKCPRSCWQLSKSSALSSSSPPPVGLKGKPICSDVSHNHNDSSANFALKAIAFLTLSIITSSPLCLSSNLPAYLGSALVKIMPISGCCGVWFIFRPPLLHALHLPPRPSCILWKFLCTSNRWISHRRPAFETWNRQSPVPQKSARASLYLSFFQVLLYCESQVLQRMSSFSASFV